MLHVVNAEYRGEYLIQVEFDDGREGVVDLSEVLVGKIFEELSPLEKFQDFAVDPELRTIVWPNGADLAPEFLADQLR